MLAPAPRAKSETFKTLSENYKIETGRLKSYAAVPPDVRQVCDLP